MVVPTKGWLQQIKRAVPEPGQGQGVVCERREWEDDAKVEIEVYVDSVGEGGRHEVSQRGNG